MSIQAAVLPGEWILPPLSCFVPPVANCIVNSPPPPDEGHCTVIDTDDKHRKAVVQHTFKVSRMIGENSVSYTVNLYPTNNRLLINGKDVDKFMKSHLPLLHQMMIRALSEDGFSGVESMNRMLADKCSSF